MNVDKSIPVSGPDVPNVARNSFDEILWLQTELSILETIPDNAMTVEQKEWRDYIIYRLDGGKII